MQKQYIGTNPLLWLVIIAVALVLVSNYRSARADNVTQRGAYVSTACTAAQGTGDFTQCYAAEKQANAEYLCKSATNCWVEVK